MVLFQCLFLLTLLTRTTCIDGDEGTLSTKVEELRKELEREKKLRERLQEQLLKLTASRPPRPAAQPENGSLEETGDSHDLLGWHVVHWVDGDVFQVLGQRIFEVFPPFGVLRAYEDTVAALTANRSAPLQDLSEQLLVYALWRVALGPDKAEPGELNEEAIRQLRPVLGEASGTTPEERLRSLGRSVRKLVSVKRGGLPGTSLVRTLLGLDGPGPLGRSMASEPEVLSAWETGVPPRLRLPHCEDEFFASAAPWEGAGSGSGRSWLPRLLQGLDPRTMSRLAFAVRPPGFLEEPCQASPGAPLLHDPTRCLQEDPALGYDTLVYTLHPEKTQVLFELFPGSTPAPFGPDEVLGATFMQRQSVYLTAKDSQLTTTTERNPDIMFISPFAGNCLLASDVLFASAKKDKPRLTGSFLPKILVLPINPLLPPPIQATPNFTRWWPLVFSRLRDERWLEITLFGGHCSLQSTIDRVASAYSLLFVDVAQAVFVLRELVPRFLPWSRSGLSKEAPASNVMTTASTSVDAKTTWRHGAGCNWQMLRILRGTSSTAAQLDKDAEFVCHELQVAHGKFNPDAGSDDEMSRLLQQSFQDCKLQPREFVELWLPGRGMLLGDRGRCLPNEGFCECFPPWSGRFCDNEVVRRSSLVGRVDKDVAWAVLVGNNAKDVASLGFVLKNWWKQLNHMLDDPIVVFHDGLTPEIMGELRRISQNHIWFAFVEDFDPTWTPKHTAVTNVPPGYRRAIRFLAGSIFDQPSLRKMRKLYMLDTDSYFPGFVATDPFSFLQEDVRLAFTYQTHDPVFSIQQMMDVALLFEAAVAGGVDRPSLDRASRHSTSLDAIHAAAQTPTVKAELPGFSWLDEKAARAVLAPKRPELARPFAGHDWSGEVFMTDSSMHDLNYWRSGPVRAFLDWADDFGGWWRFRWGSCPLRTVAAWLYLQPRQVIHMEIPYAHQRHCQCNGTEEPTTCVWEPGQGAAMQAAGQWFCRTLADAAAV